jgi:MFS family permease
MSDRTIKGPPFIAVIVTTALVGVAVAHVEGFGSLGLVIGAGVGAMLSAVIALIVSAYRSVGPRPSATESRSRRGINLGYWGVLMGALGWVIGVFLSQVTGYAVGVLGFLVAVSGALVHFVDIFRTHNKEDA